MDKKTPQPIDGVVHRQRRRNIGDFKQPQPMDQNTQINTGANKPADFSGFEAQGNTEISMDLDKDLQVNEILATGDEKPSRRSKRRQKKAEKKEGRSTLNRRLRRFALFGGIAAVLLVGFVGTKGWLALQRIIVDRDGGGSPFLNSAELKGEGDGRINILMLGVGGEGHPGGELADTIIVASIDPIHNEVAMLSVPRDMYVDVPGYWSSRINAAHAMGIDQDHPGGGPALLKETLESTLDIPIHYYIRVDFTAFVQAIDSVGGVDLYIDEAVYDTHFASGPNGYIVDVPTGWQHFDGTKALYYSRSRYTSGGGDFDRNARQRQIIVALQEKVLGLGTFSDPRRITGLADAIGDHVRTDLQISEVMRLYEIAGDIPQDKIVSYGLSSDEDNYLAGTMIDGASVLTPKAGDYGEIQRFVREIFIDGFIRSEAAEIVVFDGTSTGEGPAKVEELKSYGYKVVASEEIETINSQTYVVDLSEDQAPATKRYLEERFGVTMVVANQLPEHLRKTKAAFVIVLGDNGESI